MARLVIEDVPEELCCAFQSLSDADRRIAVQGLCAAVNRLTRTPPGLGGVEELHRRMRELQEAGVLTPVTKEFLEEALGGGRP